MLYGRLGTASQTLEKARFFPHNCMLRWKKGNFRPASLGNGPFLEGQALSPLRIIWAAGADCANYRGIVLKLAQPF
jgi:hypothetical protein